MDRDDVRQSDATANNEQNADEERREALRKLGKYAAYTAPAMLAMLTGEAYAQGDSTG
jgi:hypothetical protein